jgi:hypothetical protein
VTANQVTLIVAVGSIAVDGRRRVGGRHAGADRRQDPRGLTKVLAAPVQYRHAYLLRPLAQGCRSSPTAKFGS